VAGLRFKSSREADARISFTEAGLLGKKKYTVLPGAESPRFWDQMSYEEENWQADF
jgi:hypothetical protein